jgi:hypothetical protein
MISNPAKAFAAIGLFVLLSSHENARADPTPFPGVPGVTYTYVETPTSFELTITGGSVTASANGTLTIGELWKNDPVNITLNNIALPTGDEVIASGTAIHVAKPHAEDGNAVPFNWTASFFATDNPNPPPASWTIVSPQGPTALNHPPHKDVYEVTAGLLSVTPATGNIESWELTIEGHHSPEPASSLLIITGMLCISTWRRTRRRSS